MEKLMHKNLAVIIVLISGIFIPSFPRTQAFIIGADISWIDQDETNGAKYYDNGVQKDIFQIFKEHKFNCIRLRIFVNPELGDYGVQFCDSAHTLKMAQRIYGAGMKFMLDFHYSDDWADPGNQSCPHAWSGQDLTQKSQTLYTYTKNILTALKNQGTLPHYVQVGNEIDNGIAGETSWPNRGALLKAGIKAVKEVDSTIQAVLHIAKGGDTSGSKWWIDNVLGQDVVFDILGQSCYIEFQGQPPGWNANFLYLAARYPRMRFMIAEYSQMKRDANDIVFGLPGERGVGTFIWEPTRWRETLFDRSGNNYSTNAYMDLYPAMSKDYGNDTVRSTIPQRAKQSPPAGYELHADNRNSGGIVFSVPEACNAGLIIFTLDGRIASSTSLQASKGWNRVTFRGVGNAFSRGVYGIVLKTNGRQRAVSRVTVCGPEL